MAHGVIAFAACAIVHMASNAHIHTMQYFKKHFAAVQPEPCRADGLSVGLAIRHPTFGLGHITRVDGERLTILFKDGSKKIEASYVKAA